MKIEINKKYLALPVSNHATVKKLLLTENERLLFDLDLKLDDLSPAYFVYINTECWLGKEVELKCEPSMSFQVRQTDEKKDYFTEEGERFRPLFHFTPKNGWMNDPNGLVYDGHCYHMYFQYNPVNREWGNMHWGHAVSEDLIRWKELACALYPDEMGTMYSGSAIIDWQNRSGLQSGHVPVMLLYYTAAGSQSRLSAGQSFTQCLAYSQDMGKSFVKYENNPIVPFIEQENRDPKISYHIELDQYVMSLYLADNRYALFRSTNLLDWELFQTLALEDDAECPDFYPLIDAEGKEKWILSGASDRYVVGSFDGVLFTPETGTKRLHYGKHSYAAQTWANAPGGRRIRITWNTYDLRSAYFSRSMTFPCEMRLTDDLSLAVWPVDEIRTLYGETRQTEDVLINEGESFTLDLSSKCYDLSLTLSGLENGIADISFFGATILCDGSRNEIQTYGSTAPLHQSNGTVRLRLLIDATGFELFLGEGRAYLSHGFMMDYNLNHLCIRALQGRTTVDSLTAIELKPVFAHGN